MKSVTIATYVAERKLLFLMSHIIIGYLYAFSMLSLSHIQISDLITDLFMHPLSGMILLCLAASLFTLKVFFMKTYAYIYAIG